ncbi:MAG: endonuclease MutS2 [Caldilineae bacterium]|nr:MAG: endonuclease MutS2 [Caldilineae bacterium]
MIPAARSPSLPIFPRARGLCYAGPAMNEHTFQVLEYHKILHRLAAYCSFEPSKELARDWRPTTDLGEARLWQQETAEARALLSQQPDLHLGGVQDLRPLLDQAERGGTLAPVDLLAVRSTILRARRLRQILLAAADRFPALAEWGERIQDLEHLAAEIGRAISERGEVMDSASPRLAHLRAEVRILQDRLQARIQRIATNPENAPFLQEAIVTQRQGRYVVPVRAEFKGRIPGIVHDQSGSGATLFVEPFSVVDLNNEWRQRQMEEQEEVNRILRQLSDLVAEESLYLRTSLEALAGLDFILARAHFANDLDATEPELLGFQRGPQFRPEQHPGVVLDLKQARHPLLDPATVVPIDFHFGDDYFIIVITGPNTGGKTVSLKTAGLLTLMAQSGMAIPAASGSRLTLFEKVFADIGDEQSIEQSLSTFSSHMTNIVGILAEATPHSLVLLDELGAGTDPEEGSALARALLGHLRDSGIPAAATTHYSEVKLYAHNTAGIVNASVEFDLETLSPTYELTIGLPGRSNALAIARRLGLPRSIADAAEGMVHPESLAADALLAEIREARNATRQAQQRAEALERMAAAREAELRAQLAKIEEARRAVLNEARAEAQAELEAIRAEIARLRTRLARDVGSQHERFLADAEKALRARQQAEQALPEKVLEETSARAQGPIRVGDTVWVHSLHASGTVHQILSESEVEVQVGAFRLKVPLSGVELRERAPVREDIERDHPVLSGMHPSPGIELDLRGMRVEEALQALEDYLDAAYLADLPWVRIIHGKGTGALRQVVRDTLRNHAVVSRFRAGEEGEGGEGVTIAYFVAR